jgi:hypothetical protein
MLLAALSSPGDAQLTASQPYIYNIAEGEVSVRI